MNKADFLVLTEMSRDEYLNKIELFIFRERIDRLHHSEHGKYDIDRAIALPPINHVKFLDCLQFSPFDNRGTYSGRR